MNTITSSVTRMVWALVLLALSFSQALAEEPIGQVIFAEGEVTLLDADRESRVAERGSAVHVDDRIVTAAQARAQVRLDDGSMLSLKGGSEYLFEAQRYNEEDASLSAQAGSLFRGAMRKITGAITRQRPRNSSHASPTATIGIRGTIFQMVHVPEGGLEGFPDVDAGTYFMIEEGSAEMASDVGSVIVGPGEVYYVADRNSQPLLMPEMMRLFELGLGVPVDDEEEELLAALAGEEDDELQEAIAATSEAVVAGALDAPLPFNDVQALSALFLDPEGPSIDQRRIDSDAPDYELFFSGDGADRIMTGWSSAGDGFGDRVLADPSAAPQENGYHQVRDSRGEITSEIIWGSWAEGDYTFESIAEDVASEEDVRTPWHYMAASDVLDEGTATNLSGNFRFDHQGGTVLTDPNGDSMELLGGHVDVDFGQGEMDVLLDLLPLIESVDGFQLAGMGSFADFYDTFIQLGSEDNWEGRFSGAFSGSGGEGLLANLQVLQEGGNANMSGFIGTAAFQNTFALPFRQELGLSAHFVSNDGIWLENNRLGEPDTITYEGEGAQRVITEIEFEGGGTLVATGDAPETQGYHRATDEDGNTTSEIVWGRWAEGDYQWDSFGEEGSWHYGAASFGLDYVDGALADDAGPVNLTGSYHFDLQGSSGLQGRLGNEMAVTDGRLTVDFGEMDMRVALGLTEGGDAFSLDGLGAVQEFYQESIFLRSSNSDWFGEIDGMFSGSGAEGALAFLRVADNPDMDPFQNMHIGTLGFQRERERTFNAALSTATICPDGECQMSIGAAGTFGMTTSSNGAGRYVDGISYMDRDLGTVIFQANEGEEPAAQHVHELGDEAGQINWGIWEEGQYTATEMALEGEDTEHDSANWQYMASTHTQDLERMQDLMDSGQLSGTFEYSLVADSGQLFNPQGDFVQLADSSFIGVDFTDRDMFVSLGLEGFEGDLIGQFQPNGNDAIEAFYDQGLMLEGDQELADWTGSIGGSFAGENAEGIMALVELYEGEIDEWAGTAAFADREELSLP